MSSSPPLVWLRAFEVAARLGSFRAAASELSVTPSTISHQVRDLEARIGVPLFLRNGRGITLTHEGESYAASLRTGFELVRNADIPDRNDKRLRVGAFPFVVNEVLVPNLHSLYARLPDIEVSLHSEVHLPALNAPDPKQRVDAIIRYGTGLFPGCLSKKISDVFLAPIVSKSVTLPENPEELREEPIIRVRGPFDGWRIWALGMNLDWIPENVVLETDSYHAATLAAERGIGTCLGILPFIRPWISDQRIAVVSDLSVRVEEEFSYLVYAPYREHDANILTLYEWLIDILDLRIA